MRRGRAWAHDWYAAQSSYEVAHLDRCLAESIASAPPRSARADLRRFSYFKVNVNFNCSCVANACCKQRGSAVQSERRRCADWCSSHTHAW
jgi:hypothetical protein